MNRDVHEGLRLVSAMVGVGYRPQAVIAGFLSAENQRYLGEEEGIRWFMNRLNQKGVRPQDEPMDPEELTEEERALIGKQSPELFR